MLLFQEHEYSLKASEAWQKVVDFYEDSEGWKIDKGHSLEEGIISSKGYSGIGKVYKLEVSALVQNGLRSVSTCKSRPMSERH